MVEQTSNVIEWNANAAVLQRCSKIIGAINESRFRTTQFDTYGNVLAEAEEVLSHLICLYKEICVELNKEEVKVWGNLTNLRDKLRINPPKPKMQKMAYWKKTIAEIDDLDIKIRRLAKRHGFLAANKRDVKKAALRT